MTNKEKDIQIPRTDSCFNQKMEAKKANYLKTQLEDKSNYDAFKRLTEK